VAEEDCFDPGCSEADADADGCPEGETCEANACGSEPCSDDGPGDCEGCSSGAEADADNDGIPDDDDAQPNSVTSVSVVIGGVDTGVPNLLFADGQTLADLIAAAILGAPEDQLSSTIAALTNDLKKAGHITGAEKGKIQSAVARLK
jgi:hypothetical protein